LVLRLRSPAPGGNWEQAKCLSVNIGDDDPFFSPDPLDNEEAVAFCNGTVDGKQCILRDSCLNFSLTNNIEWGVYGGMTQEARRALRKKLPPVKSKPNSEWKWMTEEEAFAGLSDEQLREVISVFKENSESNSRGISDD